MAGESHLKERAKTQWDRLDVEGRNLINGILTAETEEIEWPTNTEPKFPKKRTAKTIRMAYDSKTKKYIYNNPSTMALSKAIRLELSEAFFSFLLSSGEKRIHQHRYTTRVRGRHQIRSNSIQLPLDLRKKHYSHCTPCIRDS